MKKRFKLEINTPCDANLNAMKKTDTGFFCSSCVKNVIDLSSKTNAEVAQFIAESKGKNSICAQLRTSQLEEVFEYNAIDKSTSLKYAVAVAASVLLTTNVAAQEKVIQNTEQHHPNNEPKLIGKMINVPAQTKMISFTLKGKLLDSTTNKPISQKEYHEIAIMVNGAQQSVIVNPETGEFSIPLTIQENAKELQFSINAADYYIRKTITFDLKSIKNNVLLQNIKINPKKEFQSYKIAGGLGVIYNDNKTKSNS